ncbi:MAG: AI-2E family transporter [Gammaproteobacteria bacterium]|nr:MAG: AI-2E family transporter [Gammaproteobacteria bacterium]
MTRSLKVVTILSAIVLAGVVAAGVGWFLNLLAPVLTPFFAAAFLAYLGDPLADFLEAKKCSRTLSVILVFFLLTVLIFIGIILVIPSIEGQVSSLAAKVPAYQNQMLNSWLPYITDKLGIDINSIGTGQIKQMLSSESKTLQSVITSVASSIFGSGAAIVAIVGNLVLIPVVTFYLLRDWDDIVAKVHVLLPRYLEPTTLRLVRESDAVLAAFIRGQIMVMLSLAIIYSVGLGIVGLDLALLIGVIAGLVSFVPYLGFIIGIVLAGLASLLQFGDVTHLVYVVIVFGVGQAAEGMVLTPMLVGDKIGLHPVAVIFAVLAGGQLFGFIGVLIALPVAAVIMVVLRYAYQRYLQSGLYGAKLCADQEMQDEGSGI